MRLYSSPVAPNAWRVNILAREKNLSLPTTMIDQRDPEARAEYCRINPFGQVPSLELDDGRFITESLVICRYLDEVSGGTSLFGGSPEDRAVIGMWERRTELHLFIPAVEWGHHARPENAADFEQIPGVAVAQADILQEFLRMMEERLSATAYLGGEHFSIADITAYVGTTITLFYGLLPDSLNAINQWRELVGRRPSVAAMMGG